MNSILKSLSLTEYPAQILELSHSTFEAYHSCPRKLEFAKLYGYNLRSRSKPGDGGTAIHLAVGEWLLTKSKSKAVKVFILNYPIDLCDNPLWKWSLEAGYITLLSIIEYFEQHTELELAVIDNKPAIEVPFIINIKHNISELMPVVYRGFIDFVFYNRLENEYAVLDLKNTTFNTSDYAPMYRWHSQCLPYALVLKRALDHNLTNLNVEYLIAFVDLMEPRVVKLEFEKTEQEIQEWTQDLIVDLTNIKTYIQSKWFPRRSKSCFSWGKRCTFYEICQSRNLKTVNLLLQSMKQPAKPFEPWITLDLEIQ